MRNKLDRTTINLGKFLTFLFQQLTTGAIMKELTKKEKHVLANKKYRAKKQKEINKIIVLNKLYLLIIILLSCLLIINKIY